MTFEGILLHSKDYSNKERQITDSRNGSLPGTQVGLLTVLAAEVISPGFPKEDMARGFALQGHSTNGVLNLIGFGGVGFLGRTKVRMNLNHV